MKWKVVVQKIVTSSAQNTRIVSVGVGWKRQGSWLNHGNHGRSIDFNQRVGLENLLDDGQVTSEQRTQVLSGYVACLD